MRQAAIDFRTGLPGGNVKPVGPPVLQRPVEGDARLHPGPGNQPLRYHRLFTPGSQWQSRGKRRILQGFVRETVRVLRHVLAGLCGSGGWRAIYYAQMGGHILCADQPGPWPALWRGSISKLTAPASPA